MFAHTELEALSIDQRACHDLMLIVINQTRERLNQAPSQYDRWQALKPCHQNNPIIQHQWAKAILDEFLDYKFEILEESKCCYKHLKQQGLLPVDLIDANIPELPLIIKVDSAFHENIKYINKILALAIANHCPAKTTVHIVEEKTIPPKVSFPRPKQPEYYAWEYWLFYLYTLTCWQQPCQPEYPSPDERPKHISYQVWQEAIVASLLDKHTYEAGLNSIKKTYAEQFKIAFSKEPSAFGNIRTTVFYIFCVTLGKDRLETFISALTWHASDTNIPTFKNIDDLLSAPDKLYDTLIACQEHLPSLKLIPSNTSGSTPQTQTSLTEFETRTWESPSTSTSTPLLGALSLPTSPATKKKSSEGRHQPPSTYPTYPQADPLTGEAESKEILPDLVLPAVHPESTTTHVSTTTTYLSNQTNNSPVFFKPCYMAPVKPIYPSRQYMLCQDQSGCVYAMPLPAPPFFYYWTQTMKPIIMPTQTQRTTPPTKASNVNGPSSGLY